MSNCASFPQELILVWSPLCAELRHYIFGLSDLPYPTYCFFKMLGTSADIMKVGGCKVSALEIEAVLLEHPAVSECCVLGLLDKTYGEVVCAIIVPQEEVKKQREEESKPAITLEELCSWAKEKLAPYKLPSKLYIWESLPRMGKVNKKELKKLLATEGL